MKISSAFPSKYLKAADLNGEEWELTIDRVEMERINERESPKPVLYFKGARKGMVCNKTNAQKIASNYGDDTDSWDGCRIVLFEDEVTFEGKQVKALRVRIPRGKAMSRPAPAQNQYAQESEDPAPPGARQSEQGQNFQRGMDDEIPF
jgi:hypothetical protein